jgi:predicted metal-dependent phosphoesterase TrpH
MKIDLHVHTTFSDGSQSPAQIIERAKTEHVEILSITDHNSVGAYAELARNENYGFAGKIINGVEIYFAELVDGVNVKNEMLGYGIDIAKMHAFLQSQKSDAIKPETENLRRLFAKFTDLGARMSDFATLEQALVAHNAGDKSIRPGNIIWQDIFSHPENAAFIAEHKMTEDTIYTSHLDNPNSTLFFENPVYYFPEMATVSRAIRAAGGRVFMAHGLRKKLANGIGATLLERAVAGGLLDGVEVFHPDHTPDQIRFLTQFAQKHNLLISGGTDHHHANFPFGIEINPRNFPWI